MNESITEKQANCILEYLRLKLDEALERYNKAKKALAAAKQQYKKQEKIVQDLRATNGGVS